MRITRRYTDEFRSDAVALAERGGRTLRAVAESLDVSVWTLREWVRQDRMKRKKRAPSPSAKALKVETVEQRLARLEHENSKLLRENEQLKEDREILKKAAAFFAKESE